MDVQQVDPNMVAKAWGAVEWIISAFFGVLCWVVKGIIADAKETKATLNRHEVESAAKLGAIEAAVKSFDGTASRIHERIDEMNAFLRSRGS